MNQPSSFSSANEELLECAICLQQCMQPVQLPCSHVFCFLCAKGTAMQSHKCALCRATIPNDFISKPSHFAKEVGITTENDTSEPRYVWFYQGYNGWWQYDDRTCIEIEDAYLNKEQSVDVLIAGSVYIIDFQNEVQYQRNRNSRKRKIKRDLATAEKKGVAGLQSSNAFQQNSGVSQDDESTASSSTSAAGNDSNSDRRSMAVGDNAEREIPVGSEQVLVPQAQTLPDNSATVHPIVLTREATIPVPYGNPTTVNDLRRYNSDISSYNQSVSEPME
ncbi:unnamed protein product [Clavelina lepadiformis]|uniref:E3 ubiquitin-protein ligase n=1 Tax=Clavelina lepadiformis TaxID=159417 RepID=A0ABP0F8B6_CLALP